MKQLNNKVLIGILLALAGIFLIAKLWRSPKRESNLENLFTGIDTSKVTAIKLYPAIERQQEIKLIREGSAWKAVKENVTYPVDGPSVSSLLQSLTNIHVQQLVAKKRDKWENYAITDSAGTHIMIYEQQQLVGDWWVGQNQGASTFMRLSSADEVYAIEENLTATVNKPFNDWRNKTFLRIDAGKINRIAYHYPADSSFTLMKQNFNWLIDSEKADSLAIKNYLNDLAFKDLVTFEDNFSSTNQPDILIEFSKDQSSLCVVKAWKRENDWVLTSTLQPAVYFSSVGTSLATSLFLSKNTLLKKSM